MTSVALTRCASYAPAAVETALDLALGHLGGLERYVRAGDRVLVKPNLLTAQPPENAATTHPQVLDALLARLLDLGARPTLGDSPAFGWVAGVAEACGVAAVARRYGVPVVDFTSPVPVSSVRPEVRKRFVTDRQVLDADVVINVAKLKAHRQLGFTGATKNLYGCMPGKRKAYFHFERGNHDADFARLIAAFAYSIPVTLNLLDGIVAMQRDGPSGGDPRPLGVLIAGTDPISVDAVAAEIIRQPEADRLL
ncbi:MAG: iron-sulfur cluster-binding domain protein, partial [Armatimonadetes bacterium]|nr:iron-sulfur cluster-binding domain protein [Armatimonadota bacterium]